MFTEKQIEVIRDLAGCYWDEHVRIPYWPEDQVLKAKERYIQDITSGLANPEVWG